MKIFVSFIVFLSITASAALAQRSPSPRIESDSGIDGPPYAVIEKEVSDLAKEFPELAQKAVYGRSVQGRALTLLRIGLSRKGTEPAPAVLISGSTHGDEYLNIEDRLPRWFLENAKGHPGLKSFLGAGGVIYLVPILNPDGYAADNRTNANGVDLNRDFPLIPLNRPGFTQPETKLLAQFIDNDLRKNNLKLRLSVDYHCCIGAMLYPWSYTNTPIAAPDLAAHKGIAQGMQKIFGTDYLYGTTWEVLGYYAFGTTKDYYYAKYGTLSFTFEGMYRVEKLKFKEHARLWEEIFRLMSSDRFRRWHRTRR
jgi:hypothetical protein